MTEPAYTIDPDNGIDVTRLLGMNLSEADRDFDQAFEAYRAAFADNEHCPCLNHARALVRAGEQMLRSAREHGGGRDRTSA